MSDATNPFQNRNELKDHFEVDRLRAELAAAREALEKASEALVFMRAKGSVAIAGFVRDTERTAPVVEMLDKLDEAIVAVRAALGGGDEKA